MPELNAEQFDPEDIFIALRGKHPQPQTALEYQKHMKEHHGWSEDTLYWHRAYRGKGKRPLREAHGYDHDVIHHEGSGVMGASKHDHDAI